MLAPETVDSCIDFRDIKDVFLGQHLRNFQWRIKDSGLEGALLGGNGIPPQGNILSQVPSHVSNFSISTCQNPVFFNAENLEEILLKVTTNLYWVSRYYLHASM